MLQKRKPLIITGAAIALVLLVAFANVAAQSFTGVGIRPAFPRDDNERTRSIFVHTIEPGSSAEDGVKLINNTDEKSVVTLDAVDSVNSSGGSFACAQSAEAKEAVGSWINLEQSTATVEPDESLVIPFTITVPEDADTGEHNGCITLEGSEEPEEISSSSGSGVALHKRSAIRVSVLIPGDIERNVDIADLTVTDRGDNGITLTPRVQNTGNVSADTNVELRVVDVLSRIEFSDAGEFPVQRGQETEWNFTMDRPFWGGWYTADFSISYLDGVEEVGAEGGDTVNKTSQPVRFFITPQPTALIVIAAAGLILLGGLITGFVLWRRHCHLKRTWVKHKVKPGETIQNIASARKTTWRKIAKINDLSPPYDLKPGTVIQVPRLDPKSKKVKIRIN